MNTHSTTQTQSVQNSSIVIGGKTHAPKYCRTYLEGLPLLFHALQSSHFDEQTGCMSIGETNAETIEFLKNVAENVDDFIDCSIDAVGQLLVFAPLEEVGDAVVINLGGLLQGLIALRRGIQDAEFVLASVEKNLPAINKKAHD